MSEPAGKKIERKRKGDIDRSKLFPYIAPYAATWELGHGAMVDLVVDDGGLCYFLTPAALATAGLDLREARRLAVENLEEAARDVQASRFEGPGGYFMVWGGDWLSAAFLLLPGLHAFAAPALETDAIVASIPHREALLLFPEGDERSRADMRALIAEKEGDGRKPITPELFSVQPDRVVPFPLPGTKAAPAKAPRWFG